MTATICELLLSAENYMLDEVAERVGYGTSSQLIRFFKRTMDGKTPNDFRKEKLKEMKNMPMTDNR